MFVNVFSTPGYLGCVADAYFPGRPYTIADVPVAGRTFRVLQVERKPVAWVPFMDFLEPDGFSADHDAAFLPAVSHGRVSAAEWRAMPERVRKSFQESPLIDFTLFPTWEEFVAYSRSTANPGFRSQRQRQQKKLEKEGLVFHWHDEDPSALRQLMTWKSEQYRASGYVDGFQSKAQVRMFELLLARKHLVVTTMRLQGRVVAGHAGLVHDRRFYYWLPAYDKEIGGVGSMLNEWMMQQSYERGHAEFDFLLGNEAYKWGYATHTRLIAPLGTEPLRDRVWKVVRARAMEEVRKRERLYRGLQELKRKVSYLRMR